MEIGATDRGRGDLHDCVPRIEDRWVGHFLREGIEESTDPPRSRSSGIPNIKMPNVDAKAPALASRLSGVS